MPDLQIFMQVGHINFAQTLRYQYFTKYQCARSANLHADLAHFCINYSIKLHRIDVWTCNKLCKQEAPALFQVLFQCHQYASQRLTPNCAAHPRAVPPAALLAAPQAAPHAAPHAAPLAGPLAGLLDDLLDDLLDTLLDTLLAAPPAALLAASQAAPFAGPLAALLDNQLASPLAALLAVCYIYIHQ